MPPPVILKMPASKPAAPRQPTATKRYMGIDPGGSGGAVVIYGREIVDSIDFAKATELQRWEFFERNADNTEFAVLEQVGGYTGRPQSGSMMFNFGDCFGEVRGFLVAARIPRAYKMASVWQKALAIKPRRKGKKCKVIAKKGKHKGEFIVKEMGGETPDQFKKRLHRLAEQLFPRSKVTKQTADAALIAHYCRGLQEGKLPPSKK